MELNDKQRKKVEKHFNEKWSNKACPFCGGTNWALSTKIFELREFNKGNLVLGENTSIFPTIYLVCDKCSHTVFLSALKMGLLEEEEIGKKKKAEKKDAKKE